jgi:hypothetical protein
MAGRASGRQGLHDRQDARAILGGAIISTVSENKTLTGTWKNGQVILDEPADWPEGCRVIISPQEAPKGEWLGITEEEWPRTPEALADWLKWLDSIEPIEMTAEEGAD